VIDSNAYPFQDINDYVQQQIANARVTAYVAGVMDGLELAQEAWHDAQGQGHNDTADTHWFGQELKNMLTNAQALLDQLREERI